jgi:prevent-host-death family protein
MRAVTIKHAKAHLNELVDAAQSGQQIVLMRGAKHVATLVPITDADLELAPMLRDDQAERLWKALAAEAGGAPVFDTAAAAVAHLRGERPTRRRRRGAKAR